MGALIVPAAVILDMVAAQADDIDAAVQAAEPWHGESAGYWRHRAADESACDPCLDAQNLRLKLHYRRRSQHWPIREWALAAGHKVGPKGPIPQPIRDLYHTAHGGGR